MSLLVWLPLIKDTKNQGIHSATTTTTGTITYNAGKLGNALTFSSSAIVMNPAPLNTNTKEFSFAFWFKPTNVTVPHCLYNGRTTTGGALGIFLLSSNQWRFDDGAQHTFTTGATLNEWHHFVFTRNESNVKLYKDGTLIQTISSSAFTCTATYASLGMSTVNTASPSGNNLVGQVNDYRIYNHVLSAREIKELSKGLMTHLPLSWGANPNMIKNSYTWMNKSGGSTNQWTNSGLTYSGSILEDNNAPCHWVYKRTIANSKESNVGGAGMFYGIGTQGLELTDLTENEYYTYSFWAKSDSGIPSGLGAGAICESQTLVSNTGFGALDSNWRKHTVTFKWTKTTKLTACFYVTVPASSTIDFQVCGMKLEKGQIATAYVPHVEEEAYTGKGYASLYYNECSGFKRTVTVTGTGMSTSTDSPRGTGTNWNGIGKLAIGDGLTIGTQPIFSINFWARIKNTTHTRYSDVCYFTTKNSSGTVASTRLEVEQTTGSNLLWHGLNSKNLGVFAITVDTWMMLTFTSDGSKCYWYKNGSLLGNWTYSSDTATNNWQSTGNIQVGDTIATYYDLADFRVYATCLSADDIKALYNISAEIDKSGKIFCNELVEA